MNVWANACAALCADDPAQIAALAATGVRAQPRCGAVKVPTYICGALVIKGPATTATQRRHMDAMIARSHFLSVVDPSLTLVPCRRVGDYLVLANVGRTEGFAVEHRTTKLESVDVVVRGSHVTRVSEVPPADLSDEQIGTIWQLFVWMAVLGVGDAGSYNLLLTTEGRVVAIDMEESRHDSSALATLENLLWVRGPKKVLAERLLRAGAELPPPPTWERLSERLTPELIAHWAEFTGRTAVDEIFAEVRARLELCRTLWFSK